MKEWLIREVAGRLVAVLLGALVAGLSLAGLLPEGTRLQVGDERPRVGHVEQLPKPSGLSSSTKVLVEPAAEVPGSPVWSGSLNGPR